MIVTFSSCASILRGWVTIKGKTYYSEFKIREDNSLKFKVSSIRREQLEPFKEGVKKKRNFSKVINQNHSRWFVEWETKRRNYLTIKEGENVKRRDTPQRNGLILSYNKDSFNKVILIKDR